VHNHGLCLDTLQLIIDVEVVLAHIAIQKIVHIEVFPFLNKIGALVALGFPVKHLLLEGCVARVGHRTPQISPFVKNKQGFHKQPRSSKDDRAEVEGYAES